jgi:hypothetical protein
MVGKGVGRGHRRVGNLVAVAARAHVAADEHRAVGLAKAAALAPTSHRGAHLPHGPRIQTRQLAGVVAEAIQVIGVGTPHQRVDQQRVSSFGDRIRRGLDEGTLELGERLLVAEDLESAELAQRELLDELQVGLGPAEAQQRLFGCVDSGHGPSFALFPVGVTPDGTVFPGASR